APDDQVLIRTFVGGTARPDLLTLDDDALTSLVHGELAALLGIKAKPLAAQLSRWPGHMPQYMVGHHDRIQAIEMLLAAEPRLALAGNAYHGVGVPLCIRIGERAAEKFRIPETPS
ncbi:MAG: FAD-dependent oxidoreductase, partial [Verrucomicrobia bacterium]|nr:FAD-dependent oxidoreductase [Verrucomicrobiota bacterium]